MKSRLENKKDTIISGQGNKEAGTSGRAREMIKGLFPMKGGV
jgi:hypothetical protein